MTAILEVLQNIWNDSGFALLFDDWRQIVMILVAFVLLYLGIVKKFEPLLLVGIAFGTLLTNLPGAGLYHPELWDEIISHTAQYSQRAASLTSSTSVLRPVFIHPSSSSELAP